MSQQILIWNRFELKIGNQVIEGGDLAHPTVITVNGEFADIRTTITNTSGDNYNSQTIWTTGDAGITDAEFIWILADKDIIVELRNDNGTDQFAIVEAKANVPMVWHGNDMNAQDDGSSPIAGDGSADTLDTVDRILVKNINDASAADVTANIRAFICD